MEKELRILILEDLATDAELIERELRKEGVAFTSRVVETREAFLEQMEKFLPDIVLSDYMMPEYNGMEALLLSKERFPFVPFIIVTGSMNEETAVECMKKGADDYVIKGSLFRLYPAVTGALERKEAKAIQRQIEENYRTLVENAVVGIYRVHADGRFIMVNQKMAEMFGFVSPQALLESTDNLTKLYARPGERQLVLQEINTKGFVTDKEVELRKTDGSSVWVRLSARATIVAPNEVAYEGILVDISERLQAQKERDKLQAQLLQAQKMEAIGTLAGGIAHDFNNILSAVIGYTELAQMKLAADSEIKDDLKEVLTAGERAKDLVKQILAFSRQTKEEKLPVQMGLIVKEALKLLRSSLPTTIDIRQNIRSKSVILSDPTQLHQIVMNLCTNAAYAMQAKGGILEVTLADVALDSDFCSTHPDIQPGAYLKLSVSDTGCGMTADIRNRIFDPFFTTKPNDKGTGLGLSVVHGIVKDCGGTIAVYSEPDKGTTFNLYFPVITDRTEDKSEEHAIIPTGTERILVVDDEKAIIDLTQKILTSLGYSVEVRTSSIEALALFKAMPAKFDLVITDMTMPQMTGDALARELMKIRPDLPVILCTGFSEKMTNEIAETIGIKAFLQKPLLKAEMGHMIRKVLDETKG